MMDKKSMGDAKEVNRGTDDRVEKSEVNESLEQIQVSADELSQKLTKIKNELLSDMRKEIKEFKEEIRKEIKEFKEEVKNEIISVKNKIEDMETTVKMQNLRINALVDVQSRIASTTRPFSEITEREGYARAGTGFNSRNLEWKKNPFL